MADQEQIEQLLSAAQHALKKGERLRAREMLFDLLRLDEEHEEAWLWLSGAVESEADQRTCLQNVLTLNPDNVAARRGLRLLQSEAAPNDGEADDAWRQVTVEKTFAPATVASAVLYPERQKRQWRDHAPVASQQQNHDVAFAHVSEFDDVWSRNVEICAYCARLLEAEDRKCPGCGRSLTVRDFRYENPSSSFYIFHVLIVVVLQAFVAQGVVQGMMHDQVMTIWRHGALGAVLLLLLILLYLRLQLAHLATLFFLGLLAGFSLLTHRSFIEHSTIENLLTVGSISASLLTLAYGAWFAAPDFERMSRRQVAFVTRGLRHADQFDDVGKRLARQGMWAAAVLHWQRASALEPARSPYLRRLGQGYLRLNYRERGLDALQAALKASQSPVIRQEIEAEIAAAQGAISTKH